MHTPDNKTAAAESAKRCDENTGAITPVQFTDLVCYILACAENQTQPEYFTPPEDAETFNMISDTDNSVESGW